MSASLLLLLKYEYILGDNVQVDNVLRRFMVPPTGNTGLLGGPVLGLLTVCGPVSLECATCIVKESVWSWKVLSGCQNQIVTALFSITSPC